MQRDNTLIHENVYVLRQGLELLDRLDDCLYSNTLEQYFRFSVGTHFRHCLDSYNCFFTGIEAGRINYDLRERDERVERHRLLAIAKIEKTIARLEQLSISDLHMPVLVSLESQSEWSHSSMTRELQFLLSHTIHHYALAALMLRLQGFRTAEEFGVAPSTLKHWRNALECAG